MTDRNEAGVAESRPAPWGHALRWLAPVLLLACHYLLALSSARGKSPTFDEVLHVTRGYTYWMTGDFRLSPPAPPLPSLWATLPPVAVPARLPDLDSDVWRRSAHGAFGIRFLFESGNDAQAMLARSRALIAVLSLALGLAVFIWSKSLFGFRGGVLSLAFYTFSPSMLAHARLVTADLATAAFFCMAVGAAWWAFQRLTALRVVCSALALAALFLSKMSALVAVLMLLVLALVRAVDGTPLAVGRRRIVRAPGKLAALACALLLNLLVVYGAVWAAYGFRYDAFRHRSPDDRLLLMHETGSEVDPWDLQCRNRPRLKWVMDALRRGKVLPELYLYSIALGSRVSGQRCSFLNGEHSLTGFRGFFPCAFLYKTSLAFLLALVAACTLGLLEGCRPRARSAGGGEGRAAGWRRFRAFLPLVLLFVAYWAVMLRSTLNIGHRHLLPVYPPLFVMAGSLAARRQYRRTANALGVALAVWTAVTASRAHPHYLAHFNAIAGGPRNGYRVLVDSSLDWGQDLIGAGEWIEEHAGDEPVFLAYFGLAPPAYYGIEAYALPYESYPYCGREPIGSSRLAGGAYLISATILQQVYVPELWEGWTAELEDRYRMLQRDMQDLEVLALGDEQALRDRLAGSPERAHRFQVYQQLRFLRLCEQLRTRQPDDTIGYSILVFRLSDRDVQRMLGVHPAAI